jgi:branched-chain amino acid transport system ATP-binding protein
LAGNNTLLKLERVHSGYGEIKVLHDVSVRAKEGEIVSIIGANGAGKSTLLKTIFGIVHPTSGHVQFQGQDINQLSPLERLRRGISYVPEGRSNFPGMTVQENMEMGAYTRNDPQQIAGDIDALCERFPILQEKRHTAAGNLSGGQQQMLEIAIALMLNPKLLLIDEPTLGLAPVLVTEVFDELQKINQEGTTIVLVEQNAKRALEISDYAFVLELGKVRFEGPAQELARNEEIIEAYLGER